MLANVDLAYLRLSVVRSLNRLGVDKLDLVHLHWCVMAPVRRVTASWAH